MGFNIKNNSWAQFKADAESAATEGLMENVGLLPTVFPYKARLKKVDGSNNVIQQEIVNVTNISGTTVEFTRAVEECPKDETSTSHVQTAWKFHTGDIMEVIMTAEMVNLLAEDSKVVHKTGDESIAGNKNFSGNVTANEFFGDGSNLTGLSAEVKSASLKYMFGVDAAAGLAMSLGNYEQLTGGTDNDFGSVAQPRISQSFYGQDFDIDNIKLMIKTISSPSDGIYIEIETDSSGVPSGTPVTNGDSDIIDYTALSGTSTEETFNFSSVPTLDATTLYHFVVQRTGATDAVNYYSIESAGADSQIGTMSKDTGSWANATDDLYFKLPVGYKLITKGGTNFIGVLKIAGLIGAIGIVNTGYDNNQTGLIPESYYGFNTTTGVIEIGGPFRAISETEINLTLLEKSSTTNLGLSEMATDSEVSAGTDEERYINSKQAKDNFGGIIAVLQTTRLTTAASGTVSIAHGLGSIPKYVEIAGFMPYQGGDNIGRTPLSTNGYSDGTINKCSAYYSYDAGTSTGFNGINRSANCIYLSLGDAGGVVGQSATITFDATNVNIVWTKVGADTHVGTGYLTLIVHK